VDFEQAFVEINGRKPTIQETKRHLAFDRLAKMTDLDPATLLLIVEPLRRSERKPPFQIEIRWRDLCVSAVTLLVFVLGATSATGLPPPPFFVLIAVFVLGLCASLLYLWISPIFPRRK
jgi:hypothetical protein